MILHNYSNTTVLSKAAATDMGCWREGGVIASGNAPFFPWYVLEAGNGGSPFIMDFLVLTEIFLYNRLKILL